MQNRKKEEKMKYKTRQLDGASEKRKGKQKPSDDAFLRPTNFLLTMRQQICRSFANYRMHFQNSLGEDRIRNALILYPI